MIALTLVLFAAAGCTSRSAGPEVLTIAAGEYGAAFDAAVEAARRDGLPATLRDRRGGVIETQPRMAGSILEPWRTDNDSLAQALENTVVYQRRRARFEFAAAGSETSAEPSVSDALAGPDMINVRDTPLDLTATQGELELRVWVYLERATIPGIRRSTWTRSKTSQAQLVYPEGATGDRRGQNITWTTIARDPEYERRLLAEVQSILARPAADAGSESEENIQPLAMKSEPQQAHSE